MTCPGSYKNWTRMLSLPGRFLPPDRALTAFVPLSTEAGYVSGGNTDHPPPWEELSDFSGPRSLFLEGSD